MVPSVADVFFDVLGLSENGPSVGYSMFSRWRKQIGSSLLLHISLCRIYVFLIDLNSPNPVQRVSI